MKTASWFAPIPSDHVRIGISRSVPRHLAAGYRLYRKLSPGEWFRSVTTAEYLQLYRDEVLATLDPQQVYEDIMRLASGRIPVLCCFEAVGGPKWCHRSLAAAWLADGLGIMVPEVGYEHLPQAQHPLLPPKRARSVRVS
jgi:hypothetical protein